MSNWGMRARRHGAFLGTLAAAVTALCALAPSAGAVIKQLPNGSVVSYQPMIGKAPAPPKNFDAAFSNLDYNGGPVMPSNTDYVIYWKPASYATAYPSDYKPGLDQYFTDLAHDSGGHQNVDSVADQYNDAGGDFSDYNMSFGGPLDDTDAYPANGCGAGAVNSGIHCLTDAQLKAEVKKFVDAQGLPHDLRHEYFLLFPPGVQDCFDNVPNDGCSAGANSPFAAYCAYHSATTESPTAYIYTNDPYVTGNSGCDNGQHPNGTSDGALQGGLSHEHNESITDPFPNTAWTDYTTGATTGAEDGDKCSASVLGFAGAFGTALGTASNGSPYNQLINGHKYLYQQEWSNQGHTCLQRFTFAGAEPTAQFASTPGSGDTMNFNAAGSTAPGGVADYHWQFENTLSQDPTTTEDETTAPTDSFTYSTAGQHTVSLTVYSSNGTSIGATRVIDTGHAGPDADFSVDPAVAPVGQPAAFAGTFSGPSGDAASAESWNFGDGSATASGLDVSHTYAATGSYRVTLTVTDTLGQQTSVTKQVAAEPKPTAAFSIVTAAPKQGQPVGFDGSGSTAPSGATIASYNWDFGDGSAPGDGATLTHTYAAPGTYTVTLTVTDTNHQSAATSQQITVLGVPTAAISVGSAHPVAGSAVAFSGTASSEPGGSIAAYSWNFGDGSAAGSGATPTHAYSHAGAYTVTLTVTDATGQTGSATAQVTVSGVPSAALTVKTKHPVAGLPVSFGGSTSTDTGSTLVSYSWSFGDGQTGSGANPAHAYKKVGRYTVTLTVTDGSGATSASTTQVKVPAASITKASFKPGKRGAYQLRLTIDGPGRLTAGSKRIVVKKATTITLRYKLSASQAGKLASKHSLKLSVVFKFVPKVGGTQHKTVKLQFKTK